MAIGGTTHFYPPAGIILVMISCFVPGPPIILIAAVIMSYYSTFRGVQTENKKMGAAALHRNTHGGREGMTNVQLAKDFVNPGLHFFRFDVICFFPAEFAEYSINHI